MKQNLNFRYCTDYNIYWYETMDFMFLSKDIGIIMRLYKGFGPILGKNIDCLGGYPKPIHHILPHFSTLILLS